MLFEKTIRRKKPAPYYLELIGGFIVHGFFFGIFILIVSLALWKYLGSYTIIYIVVTTILFGIAICIDIFPAIVLAYILRKDRKENNITTRDLVIVDECYGFVAYSKLGGFQETFLYLFFTEPIIRICSLDMAPAGTEISKPKQLTLYLPEVHFTYRRQKDYQKYQNEFNQLQDDVESGVVKLNLDIQDVVDDELITGINFHVTYYKMQAFNRLIELVNPPEFRFTYYDTGEMLISIEPIPGKEYPQEALECMEKINAMYP